MRVERISCSYFSCFDVVNNHSMPRPIRGTGLFRGTNKLKLAQVFDFQKSFRAPLMWGTCPSDIFEYPTTSAPPI
jgi:hypothetical protein